MAINSGFIGTNPQGLAFVLPESDTEKYAMQLAREHSAQLQAQAQARYQQKQREEQQYQAQLLDQKIPEYWAKVGKPINENYNKWLQDAAKFHATTGKTPFTDPTFLKRYNDEVLLPARQSKDLEKQALELLPKVAGDNDNKFTEDSKRQVNEWYAGLEADPMGYLNKSAPQLSGTPSGINDFYKTIKPVSAKNNDGSWDTTRPDTSKMMEQAYLNSSDPRWNNLKKVEYGIDPNIGDIGVSYNKEGKRVWYTNPTATGFIADEILANPTEPHNAEVLQKTGIDPNMQYAKQRLQDVITKQNAGYGRFISEAGKYGNSLVGTDTSRNYDAENQRYKREDQQMQRVRFNERNQDKEAVNAPQPTSINIPYKNGEANVQVNEYVPLSLPKKNFASVAAYDLNKGTNNVKLQSSDDYSIVGVGNFPFVKNATDKSLIGTVAQPDFASSNPSAVEQKAMVHVTMTDPNSKRQKDYLIEYDRLPENIKNSKSVKQALSNFKPANGASQQSKGKTVPLSQVRSLVGKKGYEGYTEKELIDYYKSQGYNIQ